VENALWMLICFSSINVVIAATLRAIWKMQEHVQAWKAVNASQALNYCKHMVIICQEAMAGNHSIRRCKALVCK
jgi:hypothetical protein